MFCLLVFMVSFPSHLILFLLSNPLMLDLSILEVGLNFLHEFKASLLICEIYQLFHSLVYFILPFTDVRNFLDQK